MRAPTIFDSADTSGAQLELLLELLNDPKDLARVQCAAPDWLATLLAPLPHAPKLHRVEFRNKEERDWTEKCGLTPIGAIAALPARVRFLLLNLNALRIMSGLAGMVYN